MTWDNFKEMSNIDKSLENMHYLMNKSRTEFFKIEKNIRHVIYHK